ncbi:SPW repeat protein [Rhizobium jaguaris]|uniref:SPW repeat protein n=1 Tax=Rhizobium jaguaris TaxID=1312183 RepID=UPI0039BFA354
MVMEFNLKTGRTCGLQQFFLPCRAGVRCVCNSKIFHFAAFGLILRKVTHPSSRYGFPVKAEEHAMSHRNVSDNAASAIGTSLVIASFVPAFLFPSLGGLLAFSLNSGLCGLALLSSENALERYPREWERITLGLWLGISPWVLGFHDVASTTWATTICAMLIFLPAAWMVSHPKEFARADIRMAQRRKS